MTSPTSETPYERDGGTVVRRGFVARQIGKDVVLTRYVGERKDAASSEGDPCHGSSSELAVGL